MPKPRKNYSDSKTMNKKLVAWAAPGPAMREFLSEGENNPEDMKGFGKRLIDSMATIDIHSISRESMGSFLFMCMLGQVDKNGKPKYKIADVMKQGVLVDEKKQVCADIENILSDNPTEEDKRQVVTWMLSGLKRSCEQLEKQTKDNIKNNNISNFYTPESVILADLCVVILTNYVQDCYSNGVLKPGSIIDICQKQYEDNNKIKQTVQENVLGEGKNVVDFVRNYVGLSSFVSEFNTSAQSFQKAVENQANSLAFLGLQSYLAFDRIRKNYLNNPNIDNKILFNSTNMDELKEKFKNNEVTNPTGNDLAPMDYAQSLIIATEVNAINGEEGTENFSKNNELADDNIDDPLYRYGMATMVMNGEAYENVSVESNIEFTRNEVKDNQGNVTEVKIRGGFDKNAKIIFNKTFDRKTVLKAAFLSNMEIGEYSAINWDISRIDGCRDVVSKSVDKLQRLTGNVFSAELVDYDDRLNDLYFLIKKIPDATRLNTHKELYQKLNSLNEMYKAKEDNPLYVEADADVEKRLGLGDGEVAKRKDAVLEKANSILNNTAKAGTKLDDVEKQLYTHYLMQTTRDEIKEKFKEISDITTKAYMRTTLLENGAKFPKLNADDSPIERENIAKDRWDDIKEFNNKLSELKPKAGASKEWESMCQAAQKAEQLSKKIYEEETEELYDSGDEESIKQYRESVEQLNSAMRILQRTAKKYVQHKVNTNGLNEGTKDYERLQCAKRLESFGDLHGTYLTKKMTAEMNDIHKEKGYFCAESIKNDYKRIFEMNKKLDELRKKTVTSSREFREMSASINNLLTFQKDLINKLKNGEKLTQEDDRAYYGFTESDGTKVKGKMEDAFDKVNAYIKHRLEKNDFKGFYGDRFDMAVRMRIYLGYTQTGADKTRDVREAAYENERKEIKRKEIERKEEELKRQKAEQERLKAAEKSNAKKLEGLVNEANDRIRFLCKEAKEKLGNKNIDNHTELPPDSADEVKELVYLICAKLKYEDDKENSFKNTPVVKAVVEGKFDKAVEAVKADKATEKFVEKFSKRILNAEHITTDEGHRVYRGLCVTYNIKFAEEASEKEAKQNNQNNNADKEPKKDNKPKAVRK